MNISIEQTDIGVDDWIDGVSYVQAKVEIHRDPALLADLLPLHEQITAAEQRLAALQAATTTPTGRDDATLGDAEHTTPVDDVALGDETPVPAAVADAQADLDELTARAAALYERYDAAKEIWTLRALAQEESEGIYKDVIADLEQGDPPVRRSKETKAAFQVRFTEWATKQHQVHDEVAVRSLAAGVLSVNVNGTDRPAPSLDGIRRLRKRPHGDRHFAKLATALTTITTKEVDVPAPHR